jgi:hypothetical protein
MTHYPPHIKPLPNTTVLLVHYFDDPDDEPAVSTGSLGDDGLWTWDNIMYRDEELSVDCWLPLPLIPERP